MKLAVLIAISFSWSAWGSAYYAWDKTGTCWLRGSNGADVNAVDISYCRKSQGSHYAWDKTGTCWLRASNGADVNAVDISYCRKSQGSYYAWDKTGTCWLRGSNGADVNAVDIKYCIQAKRNGPAPSKPSSDNWKLSQGAQKDLRREADLAEAERKAEAGEISMSAYNYGLRSGLSHVQALEFAAGPFWSEFFHTRDFIHRLSENVYSFDQAYLTAVAKELDGDKNEVKNQMFVIFALLPYLHDFPYEPIKQRFVQPSVERIEATFKEHKFIELSDLDISPNQAKHICLIMLSASLSTSYAQISDEQKAKAEGFLAQFSNALTSDGLHGKNWENLQRMLPAYDVFVKDLSTNAYLSSRSATDLRLIDYLRDL